MGAAILFLLVLLSGCVERPRSGVSVKGLSADLVFGIPPVEEPATPANINTEPENPLPVLSSSERPRFGPGPTPDLDRCPQAGATDFPKEEASTSVNKLPKDGRYLWVISGEQETSVGTVALPQFVNRQIVNSGVNEATGTRMFTTRERELVFGSERILEQTFEVVQDDGIYLASHRFKDAEDRTVAVFNPSPDILFLPLPALSGAELNTTGIDPTTQESLTHSGFIRGRQRVDACGEVIDSWQVEARQEFISLQGEDYTRKYHYSIATQLGGFIVSENIEAPEEEPTFKMNARVGQVEP